MSREWEKFDNDELATIWKRYLQTEFKNYDTLRTACTPSIKNMRLTPMEIIRLVDELFIRLEIKSMDESTELRN